MIRRKVFTSMALLGCLSLTWLYISSERQRFKGHSSREFKDSLEGSERSKATELANIMASRQQERKRQVSAYCETTKTSAAWQPKDLNHFIVDNKHRIVYCYIPKVACTTWKKIMAHLIGLKSKSVKSVHDQRFNLLSSHSKAKARFILENYYKFLFVREPFERLLSAYKDKFTRKTNVWKKYEKKIKRAVRVRLGANATTYADSEEIKFQDFITYLIDVTSKGSRLNEHWRHYQQLCHPCKINFDFIGHFETLVADAPFVLHEARVDQFVSFPPVHFTSTKNDLERYYSAVPREDILHLQRIYRRDFEMFGYKTSQSLGSVVDRTIAYEIDS